VPQAARRRAWIAWSTGKDCVWALHVARRSPDLQVTGLLTTVTETYGRVSMHGVRQVLADAQAAALRLPLHTVSIPTPCSDSVYDDLMRKALEKAARDGVTAVLFGDVSLAGVRAYRETRLAEVGMEALFPLWGREAHSLACEIVRAGVRAYLTCLDPRKMPREMAGRSYDAEFLGDLPQGVDPCGENGEFHTFAWDGPSFAGPVGVRVGETVERDGFVFTDLLPAEQTGEE
jgi:uncharacterized protein (TIGR00290 family)